MPDYLYSVIGLVSIAIQLIINFKVMFNPGKTQIQKASNKYRLLMLAIFAYYITDALWGILAGPVRYIALWIQIAMFAFSSIATFFDGFRTEGTEKKKTTSCKSAFKL